MIYLSKRITEKYIRNKDNPHIRIHKVFYKEPRYKNLKSWDREIYAICRDRWSLSLKNNYINEKGEIYFYASQEKLGKYIGVSRKTINESFKKLLELGLLEKESIKTIKGRANIYFLCEIPEISNYEDDFEDDYEEPCNPELQPNDRVTKGYKPCNSELQPHNHVTEGYTNKPEYNVSIINIINLINNNSVEQDQILRIFIEKKVSKDLTIKILEFLKNRCERHNGEKVPISEVRELVLQLYEEYKTDEMRIKALRYAIASRHNSIVYKGERNGDNRYTGEKSDGSNAITGKKYKTPEEAGY